MELFFEFVIVLALIIIANLVVKSGEDNYRRLFDRVMLLFSLPLLLLGVFFVLAPSEQIEQIMTESGAVTFITDFVIFGVFLQVMGIWGIVLSFYSTRQSLARFLPVDPNSAVHTLALIWAGWLAGGTLIQLTQTSLEQITEAIGTLDIVSIVLQESLFVVLGVLGVGLFIRRPFAEVLSRLGLERIDGRQLIIGIGWILLLVMVQFVAGGLWALLDPDQAEFVNELNLELQSGLDTFGEWLILALAAGIGEEILFRGALQKVLGLWITSFLFAIVHVQYGFFTPATLALFIIGFSLGIIRQRHNTTLAIFVHVGYDFVLGMIALLITQIEPLIETGRVICPQIFDLL